MFVNSIAFVCREVIGTDNMGAFQSLSLSSNLIKLNISVAVTVTYCNYYDANK